MRGKGADPTRDAERKVVGFQIPGFVIVREGLAGLAPAIMDCRCAGESFKTIAVIRARPLVRIFLDVVRDTNVAHFRMGSSMHQAAIDHASSADTGADGEIQKVVQALCGAPAGLAQRSSVDVGIEGDLCSERVPDGAGEVEIPPSQLGRGGDVAEGLGCWIWIDGSKRADSNGAYRLTLFEERNCALDGFIRRCGGNLTNIDIVRRATDGTNKLGASCFDSSDAWHVFQCTPNPATIKTPMKLSKTSRYLGVIFTVGLSLAQQQPAKPAPSLANPAGAETKPAVTVPPEAVVVTVGTDKLTRAQFEEILAALAENGRAATTPAAKRQLADQVGEILGLAQEARKRKLDQAPGIKQMMVISSDQVLANVLSKQVAGEVKIDDTQLHAYYDAHKADFEQAKAVHILIRFKGSRVPPKAGAKDLTEEEALAKAQDVRKQLLAGGDFATIAKTESDDTASATAGGSLGPAAGRGKFVGPFDQAVFSLPIGQISEPVKTPFGYHLIKVEERGSKTFEEARPDIEKKIKPELVKAAMDKVKKETPVTLDDSYFGK